MANLRDIKRRIGSVKNTRQITRAMKMVSGAKLKRAQERAEGAKPYAQALDRVLQRVVSSAGEELSHPMLTSHDEVSTVRAIVIASDKGLCGSFNGGLIRKTRAWLSEEMGDKTVELDAFGKKARGAFESHEGFKSATVDLKAPDFPGHAHDLAEAMIADFESGAVQEVYLVYNRFDSVMTQTPVFIRLLPLDIQAADEAENASAEEGAVEVEYKYEPGGQQLLDTLLPLQLQTLILQGFFDSEAGEHASRMTAMDSATRNASDLVDRLTLEYNRARQAAITTEIIEIVSGAEAL